MFGIGGGKHPPDHLTGYLRPDPDSSPVRREADANRHSFHDPGSNRCRANAYTCPTDCDTYVNGERAGTASNSRRIADRNGRANRDANAGADRRTHCDSRAHGHGCSANRDS